MARRMDDPGHSQHLIAAEDVVNQYWAARRPPPCGRPGGMSFEMPNPGRGITRPDPRLLAPRPWELDDKAGMCGTLLASDPVGALLGREEM